MASKRPKMSPASEETKRLSVLLEEEILRWPAVTVRPMFGMRAVYRGRVIFAMLPQKRAFESRYGIACKLPLQRAAPGWQVFELDDESKIASALAWLERAYRIARKPPAA